MATRRGTCPQIIEFSSSVCTNCEAFPLAFYCRANEIEFPFGPGGQQNALKVPIGASICHKRPSLGLEWWWCHTAFRVMWCAMAAAGSIKYALNCSKAANPANFSCLPACLRGTVCLHRHSAFIFIKRCADNENVNYLGPRVYQWLNDPNWGNEKPNKQNASTTFKPCQRHQLTLWK